MVSTSRIRSQQALWFQIADMQSQYRLILRKDLFTAENIKVGIGRNQRIIASVRMNSSEDGRGHLARLWRCLALPVAIRLGCRGTRLKDGATDRRRNRWPCSAVGKRIPAQPSGSNQIKPKGRKKGERICQKCPFEREGRAQHFPAESSMVATLCCTTSGYQVVRM